MEDAETDCSICFQAYSFKESGLKPHSLLCSHTYCKNCIDELPVHEVEGKSFFHCPQCRHENVVTPVGKTRSRPNYFGMEVLKNLEKLKGIGVMGNGDSEREFKKAQSHEWVCESCGFTNESKEKCTICSYERSCQSMTLKALRAQAKDLKIKGISGKTKVVLIQLLVTHKKTQTSNRRLTKTPTSRKSRTKTPTSERNILEKEDKQRERDLILQAASLREELDNLKQKSELNEKKRLQEEEEKIRLFNEAKEREIKDRVAEVERNKDILLLEQKITEEKKAKELADLQQQHEETVQKFKQQTVKELELAAEVTRLKLQREADEKRIKELEEMSQKRHQQELKQQEIAKNKIRNNKVHQKRRGIDELRREATREKEKQICVLVNRIVSQEKKEENEGKLRKKEILFQNTKKVTGIKRKRQAELEGAKENIDPGKKGERKEKKSKVHSTPLEKRSQQQKQRGAPLRMSKNVQKIGKNIPREERKQFYDLPQLPLSLLPKQPFMRSLSQPYKH